MMNVSISNINTQSHLTAYYFPQNVEGGIVCRISLHFDVFVQLQMILIQSKKGMVCFSIINLIEWKRLLPLIIRVSFISALHHPFKKSWCITVHVSMFKQTPIDLDPPKSIQHLSFKFAISGSFSKIKECLCHIITDWIKFNYNSRTSSYKCWHR